MQLPQFVDTHVEVLPVYKNYHKNGIIKFRFSI